ncbi:MAG: DUF2726 domain-containing protein [Robiginitomaculum sp.]|nr:DUF2726 domain-containing protein [Robiginitomaculum sp.]
MLELLITAGIGAVFWLVLRRAKWPVPKSTQADRQTLMAYEACESLFVNAPEQALFTALLRHKQPGFHVMAKVRLEDILRVKRAIKDTRLRWQYRGRIKSRHVDFIICDGRGRVIYAIELDGRSHLDDEAKMVDGFKDAIFQHAGINLLRTKTGTDFNRFAQTLWKNTEAESMFNLDN